LSAAEPVSGSVCKENWFAVMRKALVIGSCGLIGSEVWVYLARSGYSVSGIDIPVSWTRLCRGGGAPAASVASDLSLSECLDILGLLRGGRAHCGAACISL